MLHERERDLLKLNINFNSKYNVVICDINFTCNFYFCIF